jgi:DNA-binding NarL/FixJ family response regulator
MVSRARILVADDHKMMRDLVVHVLNREFEVLEALSDGQALLEAAARLLPDVCVLDISMPKMGGIEAATRLKESGSASKIVFLTIHDDADFVAAALETGAKGYVIKSRLAADLLIAVRDVLAGGIFVSSLGCNERHQQPLVDQIQNRER